VIPWEELRREVAERKRERWIEILVAEPRGRAPGRRPRDPLKERLLLELDRARLERSALATGAGGLTEPSERPPE